jgi:putative addiction module component (TIGR02574 family)
MLNNARLRRFGFTGSFLRMARPLAKIQEEIRALSAAEKREIMATLLEELDGPPDDGAETAWLDEAERRVAEIDSGTVTCIPADEVLARLDKLLQK